MLNKYILISLVGFFLILTAGQALPFEEDIIKTSAGDLKITCIAHGTLMFTFNNKIIHIDPVGSYADYNDMPKADLIFVTHEHGDHLDQEVIEILTKEDTTIVLTEICYEAIGKGEVMKNGETATFKDIKVEAVPAYNIVHTRGENLPYHPKGDGNGYILTFGDKRVYVAGDTENTPEMKSLKNIDIAFLPMNLPYTMSPEMVANAAKAFRPAVLYPYHYSQTNPQELVTLLKDESDIEVRIRNLR
ncbi:MAG: MBL fold metallo-hydrolase [Candidatus Aminicenantes bacterium]|nr:MBL fold metallo-hydrolase [Candidatus Aminicenantes bacterium]